MKSSITRGARLGALGVASALAFGGVVATSASATEGDNAPTEGTAFEQLAAEFFQDESVQAVLRDGEGHVVVQQLEGAHTAMARIDASATAAEVADRYENVTIVPVAEEDVAQPLSSNDVVGGAGIYQTDAAGTEGGLCSVGFPAWNKDGEPAIITAGHCVAGTSGLLDQVFLTAPSGDTAGGGAEDNSTVQVYAELGTTTFGQFGGAGNTDGSTEDAADIATVDVTNPDLTLVAGMTDWTNTDDLSASLASKITSVGTAQIGETVRRSGRTTGYSSGEVWDFEPYVEYDGFLEVDGHLVKGFAAQTKVVPGDSGGTILQGETAVGIASATLQLQDTSTGDVVEFMWGADLQYNLAKTDGYTVKLDLAAPEVTTAPSGTNFAWNHPIEGTGAKNATLEYAFAPIGSDETFENSATTAIDADGTWSFTAPSTPGDYTIFLRSVNGFDKSETVSYDAHVYPTAPEITSPVDGETIDGDVTTITGTAGGNAEITLSGAVESAVKADEDGKWSAEASITEPGEYTVSAKQTVNGKTGDAATVTFTIAGAQPTPEPSPEAPAAPEFINPVDGGSYEEGKAPTTVVGQGVNGATVELLVDGQSVGTQTVEANVFEFQIDALGVGEHQLVARQTVDGATSADAVANITVTAVQSPEETPAPQPEENTPAPEESTPAPQQPNDDDKLAPTGAEFNAAAPLALGFGLVVVAGGVLLIARRRQVNSQR